ncbi:NAD-dependent epimerase/dehydratase family protein [Streptacidiphilus sp. P02-A3a]|uniref:NAD-dependent epimerase/dehydratase family protein n=1 Tax=Streptacidiphilus sp. P02-A3a TaxID=2704468 RepID=UPI0015FD25A6|nr:NAD-dependent epimerase/dehydratase family protein [Streptacidiphilus sp. P02-A3a]QMU68373.1 NAD-dependent epimerase/dehydratase family protein [Streptacidiphilus sp. P02-A3a]
MKVFLTGGSGYIGRSTIRALLRHGIEVTALARSERSARTVADLGATPLTGALADTDVLRGAAGRADGVIHLGADYSEGTAAVDRAAAEAMQDGAGSRPYVHTGGVWVYGDTDGVVAEDAPLSPPRITAWRLDNEKRVLARAATGEHPVVVMPGLVYGRSGGLTQSFFVEPGRAAGAVPCIGDGAAHWALVHVDDIAELYVLALNARAGSVYAGVSGQNLPLAEITLALSHAAGCPGRIDSLSLDQAVRRMGPIAEAFALDQQFTGARARRELGWTPTRLDALAELSQQ